MKKFTKKALNELKRSEEFNNRVEKKLLIAYLILDYQQRN